MIETALRIGDMSTYTTDSTGARIAWARKQRKLTGHDLARLVGVRNVYISQLENDKRQASRQMLQSIATALGTTVGFLLMETDDPEPAGVQPETPPYFFSEEADQAARLVDAAEPEERARMLAVLRVLASLAVANNSQEKNSEGVIYLPKRTAPAEPMQQRLILGEYFGRQRERPDI